MILFNIITIIYHFTTLSRSSNNPSGEADPAAGGAFRLKTLVARPHGQKRKPKAVCAITLL